MTMQKIGIIGGGASGIGVGKAFRERELEFEIIEQTAAFGGNWQPDGPASKMYRSAHLISSRRNTQFSDFPMPADYPAYPSHAQMHRYLLSIADHYDLARSTRFNTGVSHATPRPAGGWQLTTTAGEILDYDALVVCNGLLRTPLRPAYPGHFMGEEIHAGDYRSNTLFEGKRVLVVGGGNSGCDIAVDVSLSAATVFHSTRRGYHYMPKFIAGKPTQEWLMDEAQFHATPEEYWKHVRETFKLAGFDGTDFGLPEPDHAIAEAHPIMNSQILYAIGHGDIHPRSDIREFDERTVTFTDGSRETVDAIIWATGYDISLPFLSGAIPDIRAEIAGSFLRMVSRTHDDLLFVGYLNTPSGIGNVANIMGRFAAAYFAGRQAGAPGYARLQNLIASHARIDLGEDRFMTTDRHAFEVDLWKFIRSVNFATQKLNERPGSPNTQPVRPAQAQAPA